MNTRKAARAIVIRLLILTGILIAFTLFINLPWFDEELNKDLAGLTPPRDVSMDGNAYPLFYGFLAAADRDPQAAGLKIIRTMQERSRAGGHATLTNDEVDEILGHPDPAPVWSEFPGGATCDWKVELDCANRLIAQVAEANPGNARLHLLMDRFEQLLQVPRFEEFQEFDVYTVSTPMPWGAVTSISRIRLAESFRAKTTERFLQDIDQDIRFWKRMLDGGQTLMSKMIALAGLRVDTVFLSTLIHTRQLSAEELRGVPDVLPPLTESQRNIEETFLAELRIGRVSQMSVADSAGPPMSSLWIVTQENASANEAYLATTLPLRLRASLSAAEFYRQRAYEPLTYPMRFMPPPLYNLGGKLLLKNTLTNLNWQDYISRVHDLDGRIALVLLQAEIALNANNSVQDVVDGSRYRNPYTGEPMDYDYDKGTISFPCLAIGKDVCAVRVR